MTKTLTVLVGSTFALLLAVGLAIGWDEPSGFRDIPWGSPPAVVKEKLPDLSCGYRNQRCVGDLLIGIVHTQATFLFEPTEMNPGLDMVTLYFPSEDFIRMKVAFVEKYGEPTSRRTETGQNLMGTQFENELLEWRGKEVVITLDKYGSRVAEGRAVLQTLEGQRIRQKHL
jgi:hypothetical protein